MRNVLERGSMTNLPTLSYIG